MRTLAATAALLAALGAACARPAGDVPPAIVDSSAAAAPAAGLDSMIRLVSPLPGAIVASPLTVSGEARGRWYFEASFPVRLLDADGRELAVAPAQAQGEWMTPEFVPFETRLTFVAPAGGGAGTLVLEKDNASGLPEHADERRIPVRFAPPGN